ncbi:MAG: TetR/AcrR family transcriptional regulator C-terminal domain-containing protein [Eubacterium sp.]
MKRGSNSSCSEQTKQSIAYALKELMKVKPFEKITVSDITDKCKIHRQTFYYHFQDRYELLDWLLYNELVLPFITDLNINTVYDRFYTIFDIIYNDKRFYQAAFSINVTDISKYISTVSTREFARVISEIGKENGIDQNSIDNKMVAEFFGYGFSGVVISWASRGMKETPKEMTENIEKFIDICKKLITDRNI